MRKIDSILKTPLGNYLVTVIKSGDGPKFDDSYVLEEILVPHDGIGVFIESYFDVREFFENGHSK